MITLRQLRVFAEVARAGGSVTQAAARLYVSQPSVSDSLRSLEKAIGAKLVAGRGKSRGLTPAGETYWDFTRQILSMIKDAQQAVADLEEFPSGRLTLVAVPTAGEHLLPAALDTFLAKHPRVDVSLLVANRANAIAPLRDGSADLAIMGRPPEGIGAEAKPFLTNRLILLGAPSDKLSSTLSDLAAVSEATLLMREQGSGTRAAVEQLFASKGVEIRRTMVLGSNAAVVAAVRQGLGVAVLPEIAVADDVAQGRLVRIDVPGFPLARQWHVVWLEERYLSSPARAFISELSRLTLTKDGSIESLPPSGTSSDERRRINSD